MSDIGIHSISQCEAYLSAATVFGQHLEALMSDLKSAIDKAAGVWHDESIQRAQADVSSCMSDMASAFSQLQPVLGALKSQIDWARSGQNI